ncbi:MAG: four helix bundle protein [Candidatus Omnitrophota bacterium]|jgi:four helix bundle protein
MSIQRFEDLNAWQNARVLVNFVYDLRKDQKTRDFNLVNQIQRAAVSVMANISEGFGRFSFKDSKQFYTIARGSIAEVQSHLYILLDRKMVSKEEFVKVYEQSVITNKLINGLIRNANCRLTQEYGNSQTRELTNPRTRELNL